MIRSVFAAVLACVLALPAAAQSIRVDFQTTQGENVFGHFVYSLAATPTSTSTSVPPPGPGAINYARYALTEFSLTRPTYSATYTGSYSVRVLDAAPDTAPDFAQFDALMVVGTLFSPSQEFAFTIGLFNETNTFLTSTALPVSFVASGGMFDAAILQISGPLYGGSTPPSVNAPISFSFSRVVSPPVPEPAAWAMMIAGFGMIGGAARYRRTRLAAASHAGGSR